MFPESLACLAWEPTERLFFVASSSQDGSIYQMNLFRQRKDEVEGTAVEAIGGGGVNDVVHAMDDSTGSQKKRLINVG